MYRYILYKIYIIERFRMLSLDILVKMLLIWREFMIMLNGCNKYYLIYIVLR